jgi:hypothetical protein|tara:strand:- start:6536 stop:7036 length:501 start_codon:yes stop_codon:yes gene_type:complete
MATGQVHTMNLSDDGEGMVPLHDNPSTSFMQNGGEKNISQSKETTMDSTPINDIMMDPPMMNDEPRMQGMMPQMTAPQPQAAYPSPQAPPQPEKKNPLNLTDEQLTALVVAVCAAAAVSKPIQDRLATSIPKFLNEQGGRSVVGLAATGAVAAIIFYITKDYIVKP